VHWIQALHTANKPKVYAKSWRGFITDIAGEVVTVVAWTGRRVRFRNHHSDRIAAAVARCGSRVLVNDQYAILRVQGWCFSVAVDDGQPLRGCSSSTAANPRSGGGTAYRIH